MPPDAPATAFLAPLSFVAEFPGWPLWHRADVALGRNHTQVPSMPPLTFSSQMPVIWMSKSTGRFVRAKVFIVKAGPLRHLLGFQGTQPKARSGSFGYLFERSKFKPDDL